MKPTSTALALASVFTLTMLNVPQAAAIAIGDGWTQADHVTGTVTAAGSSWDYQFQVHNDSFGGDAYGGMPVIVDWELPYYDDMGITGIYSADGWSYEIAEIGVENTNTGWSGLADWMIDPAWAGSPFNNVTKVIHWYCDGSEGGANATANGCFDEINPGGSLGNFGFTAGYSPTDAPYQSSWDYVIPRRVGDPPFPIAPGSPSALGNTVPEPGTLALLGLGMVAAIGVGRKKRRKLD